MIVSASSNSINGITGATQRNTTPASANPSTSDNTVNAISSTITASNPSSDENSSVDSSTKVTLSPEAQALGKLAAEGITSTETSLAGLAIPTLSSGESLKDYAHQLGLALQSRSVTAPTNSYGQYDGAIAEPDFNAGIAQLGGTKTQAGQIFASLDTDHSGSISNSELLNAMSELGSDPNSSSMQTLAKLVDTNSNKVLTSDELLRFETAMVSMEKPAS
jgi:hypothetical protein